MTEPRDPRDPRDRLRDANPVPPGTEPSADDPMAQALFHRIVTEPPAPERVKRRRVAPRLWIVVPVAILLLAAAGFGLLRSVRQPLTVTCYERPSLNAHRDAVAATGAGAVRDCAALWKPGALYNPTGKTPAPPLTACVLPDGTVGVFPQARGTDTCARLGLPRPKPLAGSEASAQAAAVALQNAVADRFLSACIGRQEAVAFVRSEFARLGLRGWRIAVTGRFSAERPCASAAYDVPGRILKLVPIPKPAS